MGYKYIIIIMILIEKLKEVNKRGEKKKISIREGKRMIL